MSSDSSQASSPSSSLDSTFPTTRMDSADPPSPSSSITSPTSSSMPPTTSTSQTSISSSTTSSPTSSTSSSDTSEPTFSSSTTDVPPTTTSSDPPTTTSSSSTTTTRHHPPSSTFESIVFVSTTDSRGSPTSTAPSAITSTFTSTGTDGGLVTVTQTVANPTLVPNNPRPKDNGFFGNTGAVTAVFVLVGLAAASIALWILFALRRRRRQRRIERETAAAASYAAAHRSPLDDDDIPQQPQSTPSALEMSQRRSSSRLASTSLGPRLSYHDDPDHPDAFNPYADFGYPAPGPMASNASRDGYTPARTSSPPIAHPSNASQDPSRRASASGSLGSTSGREGYMGNHSATPSGASYEPLMASYYRQTGSSGQLPVVVAPPASARPPQTPPASSSQLLVDDREPTEAHSMFTADDRLDPALRQRQKEAESASMKDLTDDQDYSRPVLGVRNLP